MIARGMTGRCGTRPIRAGIPPGIDEALFVGAALDEQRPRMPRGREETQWRDPHENAGVGGGECNF